MSICCTTAVPTVGVSKILLGWKVSRFINVICILLSKQARLFSLYDLILLSFLYLFITFITHWINHGHLTVYNNKSIKIKISKSETFAKQVNGAFNPKMLQTNVVLVCSYNWYSWFPVSSAQTYVPSSESSPCLELPSHPCFLEIPTVDQN